MTTMSISTGRKIRLIREAEELTREQFAELTGIPAGAQKHYETGRTANIGGETLMKITQHERFKKYTLWLMTGDINADAGQISPALSPDISSETLHQKKGRAAG